MPAIGFRIARASACACLLVVTNLTAAGTDGSRVPQVATVSHTKIAAPDQPGPFHVGVMVFSATLSGGRTTRVQVFYPTAESIAGGDPSGRRRGDCATRYRVDFLAGFYELQSLLCAQPDARAVPGWFPLVVHDHGGGDPLAGTIDPARIGISGISAGAAAAIGAAAGVADHGVPADPRIKAMVVYEPGLEYSLDDASRIAIPYLIMGGHNRNMVWPFQYCSQQPSGRCRESTS